MDKNSIENWGGTKWVDVEDSKQIEVTVALPTWENKDIIWLQLESLCKQETQYKWELIVCEEQTPNMAGEEMILSYSDRLRKVGCVRVSYIPLEEHVPLSKKWWIIAHASLGSTYLLTASDNYSPKNRIEFTHNKIKGGNNWVDVGVGLFLHLFSFNTGTFKNELFETGLFMGTKTSYIKRLKGPWPKKGIDAWIRGQMNIFPRYRHNKPLLGLHTDGANKISKHRKLHYWDKNNESPYGLRFNPPVQKLSDIIEDSNIISKLRKLFFVEGYTLPEDPTPKKEITKSKKHVTKSKKVDNKPKKVVKKLKKESIKPKKESIKPKKEIIKPKKVVNKPKQSKKQSVKKFINIRPNKVRR